MKKHATVTATVLALACALATGCAAASPSSQATSNSSSTTSEAKPSATSETKPFAQPNESSESVRQDMPTTDINNEMRNANPPESFHVTATMETTLIGNAEDANAESESKIVVNAEADVSQNLQYTRNVTTMDDMRFATETYLDKKDDGTMETWDRSLAGTISSPEHESAPVNWIHETNGYRVAWTDVLSTLVNKTVPKNTEIVNEDDEYTLTVTGEQAMEYFELVNRCMLGSADPTAYENVTVTIKLDDAFHVRNITLACTPKAGTDQQTSANIEIRDIGGVSTDSVTVPDEIRSSAKNALSDYVETDASAR